MNSNSPFTPGSRLAAYVRDGGVETQDLSTSQQEMVIRDWAEEHSHILTIIFKDEATPGSSEVARDGVQDMMHYFRTGGTELGIVIWNFQRFSRDIDDSQFFRADLRRRVKPSTPSMMTSPMNPWVACSSCDRLEEQTVLT